MGLSKGFMMERLPPYLRTSIESACEQFLVVNYTFHGDKDKLRISIMFSNSENKQAKRKSNSTVMRDVKRMKEYGNNRSVDIHANKEDRVVSASLVEENEVDCEINGMVDSNRTMDIDGLDSLSSASRFSVQPVIDFSPVVNIDNNLSHPSDPQVEKVIDNQLRTRAIVCKQPNVNSKVNNEKESKLSNKNNADKKKTNFTKFVLKQSRSESDILIGKTYTGKLVLYMMYNKTYKVLTGKDSSYWKYNKILSDDFDDVRHTKLMSDEIRIAIDKMEQYVVDNDVISNIL